MKEGGREGRCQQGNPKAEPMIPPAGARGRQRSPLLGLVAQVPAFTGTIVGGENLMALPADLKVAGQGDVCSADLLFLVKK